LSATRNRLRVLVLPPVLIPLLMLLLIGGLISLQLWSLSRPATIYYGHPLKGTRILIDPGHGGIDPGSHHNGSFTEKEVVLAVGLELRHLLEQAGAEVLMTRETDEDVSRHIPGDSASRYQRDMKGRVKLINESGADLFVSLHVNYIYDPTVRGAIVFYCSSRPENKLLAEAIQKNINPVVAVNPRPDQYIHQNTKEGSYLVLNCTEIPGVIVEMAFMTSPDDRELMKQDSYRKKLAQAVLIGIAEYIYGRNGS
jgi:N-acetylmuramoyl-L-alanine amidase CwlD